MLSGIRAIVSALKGGDLPDPVTDEWISNRVPISNAVERAVSQLRQGDAELRGLVGGLNQASSD